MACPPCLLPSTHPEGLAASPCVYSTGVALSPLLHLTSAQRRCTAFPAFQGYSWALKQRPEGCPGERPSWTGESCHREAMGPGDPVTPRRHSLMGAPPLLTHSVSVLGTSSLSRRDPFWVGTHPHSPVILQEDPQVFRTIHPCRQSFITDQDLKKGGMSTTYPNPLSPQASSGCQGLSPCISLRISVFGSFWRSLSGPCCEGGCNLPAWRQSRAVKGLVSLPTPCSHLTLPQDRMVQDWCKHSPSALSLPQALAHLEGPRVRAQSSSGPRNLRLPPYSTALWS